MREGQVVLGGVRVGVLMVVMEKERGVELALSSQKGSRTHACSKFLQGTFASFPPPSPSLLLLPPLLLLFLLLLLLLSLSPPFSFFFITRGLKIETGLDRDPEIDRGASLL